jgi:dTDP-4-amino-4,6-dideoxygalactose transaminase
VPDDKPITGVPLLDLNRQYAAIGREMEKAVIDCARSTRYILGPAVEEFEKAAADYCGAKESIGVTSGSDALIIALMAEGIGPGDKVITTPFTFFATAGAIWRVGAIPVFVDIEEDGFNIDPDQVAEAAKQDGVKAVIPVHLFGQCADMDPIMEIAEKHGLIVIEDAAQAIGSEFKGKRAGSMGHYGCFSFFPSKNLGCMGDGGLVICNDEEKAEKLRIFRNHGSKPKYYHRFVGGNFRIDAMQAAVLSVKLPCLDSWTQSRQKNAADYRSLFADAGIQGLTPPPELPGRRHIYNQFTLRIKDGKRDRVLKSLHEKNIGCEVYYPVPLHLQECFAELGHKEGDMPKSEIAAGEVISIPIFPELTDEEKKYVVDALAEILS